MNTSIYYLIDFNPSIGEFQKKLANKIEKQLPGLKFTIWSTKSIQEFLLHLTPKFITILQVEIDALKPVYAFLKN